jgi:putative ABC transport system permease protein
MVLVARTGVDPDTMLDTVRRTIRSQDPELPASPVTLGTVVESSVQGPRSRMSLLAAFAAVALLLATIGIAGVVAYTVSRMLRDIGVRMALGANRRDILGLVFVQGLTPAVLGLIVGTAGAVLAARALAHMLFEVGPADPATFASAAAVLMMTAVLACLLPAFRATRVDPLAVLRVE